MADEKMNDKEDEQCDEESQASKETTSSSNPVPVEEGPVTEALETDQQPIRNRRSSSPTGEEVEPEGKRPRNARGSSSDSNLPDPPNQENNSEFSINPAPAPAHIPPVLSQSDLIKQLLPGIESWLHSHITEFITLPPTTTSSIPGVPNNPSRPPRPPKPPIPLPPKLTATSDQRQRIQQAPPHKDGLPSHTGLVNRLLELEAVVNKVKAKFVEMSIVTEDMVTDVDDCIGRVQYLEAVVNKLKGGSDDKLKAEVVKKSTEGQGEIASDDKICSLDELKKDDNTSQDEMKDDYYTCQDQLMDANTSQDELKDANTSQDETMDDKASQDEM